MAVRRNWGQRKRVPVTLPADLEAELDKVRKAAPPPPSDDPIYKYLRHVYRLRQKLESSPEWQAAVGNYHKAHRLRIEKNYIRFIIQLTAGDYVTDNMKNKYKVTLQLALKEGIRPVEVIAFVKNHGGLNKCVGLWKNKYGSPRKKRRKKNP
jgi:hypothetical protein